MPWISFLTAPAVHVLPANELGDVLDGHVPSPWCECQPIPSSEMSTDQPIWTHRHDS